MILTLTPNPAVDVTLVTEHVDRGASRSIDTALRRAGGKGVNVSRVLVQQGVPTHAVLPVGRDDEAWFREDLAAVPHTLVVCEAPTRHSYAIVETGEHTTSMLNESGAARGAREWEEVLTALHGPVRRADVLVASGSLPPGAPSGTLQALTVLGRSAGIPVVLDVAGSHLLAAADAGADVLKPNLDELVAALGEVEPLDGARALQRRGARLVVVSLGADGMLLVPVHGDPVHARLTTPLDGNPTGAGDAAVAAVASLVRGRDVASLDHDDLTSVARRAVAWSAAAVLSPWAGELSGDPVALEDDVVVSEHPRAGAPAPVPPGPYTS